MDTTSKSRPPRVGLFLLLFCHLVRLLTGALGHIDKMREELSEPQVGESSISSNPVVSPFKPIWLSSTPRPGHESLKAQVSSTKPKQWKSPHSPPCMGRDERYFGMPGHKTSISEFTSPTATGRATSELLRVAPIDCRPFAQARRIRGQHRKSHGLNLHSLVTSKGPSGADIWSPGPAKRLLIV